MPVKKKRRRNPLAPPNLQKLLGSQAVYKPPKDIDQQIEHRVQLETGAAVNAINRSRAMGQHMYKLQSEEARGWQTALVGMLTGGKTGADAEKYSKENFGGSYLAGIAMQEGTKLLTTISNDFNMKDWDAAAQLAEIYDQMPAMRDKFRADILSEGAEIHQMSFDNRLKMASLVLEDWYKRFSLNLAATELGADIQSTTVRNKQAGKALRIRAQAEKRQARKDIRDENKDRRQENKIDVSASIQAGIWVNALGQAVPKPPGYPPKPPPRWKPATRKGGPGEPWEPTPRAEALGKAGGKLGELTKSDMMYQPPTGPPIPLSYGQGFQKAKGLVYDELKAFGFSDARINALVRSRIARFGLKKKKKRK